jgi:TPR repeat protein
VAQDNLAFMYYNGRGVPRDYEQAAVWTLRAAEQGYAQAQTDLGYLYEQGKGVSLNYVTAYTWYHLAAAGGDRRAAARMKSLASVMTREQVTAAAASHQGPSEQEPKSYVYHETSPQEPRRDPAALTRPPGPFSN